MHFLDEETKTDVKEAIQEDRILFLEKDNGCVGFLTWLPVIKNEKLYIYLSNMFLEPEYRNNFNIFSLRKFFREKYPNAKFFYWHRDNDNKYFYAK